MRKIITWYKKSNRYKHAWVGCIILVAYFLLTGGITAIGWLDNLMLSSVSVLIAMVAAEYKDWEHGGAFDWYDILAGMTSPVLAWVCSLIILIIK